MGLCEVRLSHVATQGGESGDGVPACQQTSAECQPVPSSHLGIGPQGTGQRLSLHSVVMFGWGGGPCTWRHATSPGPPATCARPQESRRGQGLGAAGRVGQMMTERSLCHQPGGEEEEGAQGLPCTEKASARC